MWVTLTLKYSHWTEPNYNDTRTVLLDEIIMLFPLKLSRSTLSHCQDASRLPFPNRNFPWWWQSWVVHELQENLTSGRAHVDTTFLLMTPCKWCTGFIVFCGLHHRKGESEQNPVKEEPELVHFRTTDLSSGVLISSQWRVSRDSVVDDGDLFHTCLGGERSV